MDGTQILTLGLGLEAPWILKDQHLDTSVSPRRLDLYVEAERGSLYPCPECGEACPAHDFSNKTWRHLNFFQHHCHLHARVPRTKCPEHGVKRIEVPWARPGSDFTLLFEQAAMSLVKEMPVLAVSRQLEISDKRLWRIVHHYVGRMLGELDLSNVATVGVDETASRRGQRYVTVFLDMQRKQEPVIFAVPGHGKDTIKAFSAFLAAPMAAIRTTWSRSSATCHKPSSAAWPSTFPRPRLRSTGSISCRPSLSGWTKCARRSAGSRGTPSRCAGLC